MAWRNVAIALGIWSCAPHVTQTTVRPRGTRSPSTQQDDATVEYDPARFRTNASPAPPLPPSIELPDATACAFEAHSWSGTLRLRADGPALASVDGALEVRV